MLYEGALDVGAEVITGVEVTKIDTMGCSLTLAHGDVLTADVIIGADGPRGQGRRMLLDQDEDQEKLAKSFVMYECVSPFIREQKQEGRTDWLVELSSPPNA